MRSGVKCGHRDAPGMASSSGGNAGLNREASRGRAAALIDRADLRRQSEYVARYSDNPEELMKFSSE
jgi:hypothetical protein